MSVSVSVSVWYVSVYWFELVRVNSGGVRGQGVDDESVSCRVDGSKCLSESMVLLNILLFTVKSRDSDRCR